MASVLPLVVAVGEGDGEADRGTTIAEVAQAVGAELFEVEPVPEGRPFQARILEALIRAERRRFKHA